MLLHAMTLGQTVGVITNMANQGCEPRFASLVPF